MCRLLPTSPWCHRLSDQDRAAELLGHFRINTEPTLYTIGSFDRHVTVLSQQTRALNLAWALVESGTIPTWQDKRKARIAIVGAGFAGLTLAAALRLKHACADVVLFEERDALLPLQQGSDTRWLHPHIYDWPIEGSEASAAMLPVLNWTAGRASDVVVQVLGEWGRVMSDLPKNFGLTLYCNTRHLQIASCKADARHAQLEWVGEERNVKDGAWPQSTSAKGDSDRFDVVILAVGFGVETGDPSYWRNENFGQPSLNRPRATYLVSGQGDGAMIDLFRVRISQFRQDRILEELFGDKPALIAELKKLKDLFRQDYPAIYQRFEALNTGTSTAGQMAEVIAALGRRLRRDTDAVLRLKVRSLADLLEPATSRMSFQNALLTYVLYKCGGFAPSTEEEGVLLERFAIADDHIIRRHGTKRLEQLSRIVGEDLYKSIAARRDAAPAYNRQLAEGCWPGGYFGHPGRSDEVRTVDDSVRRSWRKEYLPGATAVIASTLCGAVAAAIERIKPEAFHFRVTLHRTLVIGSEELLQQCCDYVGRELVDAVGTAGRTLPASAGTIGQAYETRRIVRTKQGAIYDEMEREMIELGLEDAARNMLDDVTYVLAIPVVQPDTDFFSPSPTAAILYIDSRSPGFWLDDGQVDELRALLERSIGALESGGEALGRLRNLPLRDRSESPPADAPGLREHVTLEIVESVKPAATAAEFVLNFDHSDLGPATTEATADGKITNTRTINA